MDLPPETILARDFSFVNNSEPFLTSNFKP